MTMPPLLAIAAGKKVRLRKAPKLIEKELSIHLDIVNLLKVAGNPKWRWTHIGHGELRDIRTAQKLKAMGVQPGWPDFIFIGPAPTTSASTLTVFLELKAKGKKQSESQKRLADWFKDHGVMYGIADNTNDAIAFLSRNNIILIRRP